MTWANFVHKFRIGMQLGDRGIPGARIDGSEFFRIKIITESATLEARIESKHINRFNEIRVEYLNHERFAIIGDGNYRLIFRPRKNHDDPDPSIQP